MLREQYQPGLVREGRWEGRGKVGIALWDDTLFSALTHSVQFHAGSSNSPPLGTKVPFTDGETEARSGSGSSSQTSKAGDQNVSWLTEKNNGHPQSVLLQVRKGTPEPAPWLGEGRSQDGSPEQCLSGLPRGSKCLSSAAPHTEDYRAARAGAPERLTVLQWLATTTDGPKSIKKNWPSCCPGQCLFWLLGLQTLMDNKTIYSTQCGRLFKPSTKGSRTFLALPAKTSAEGGESGCLLTVSVPTQSSLQSKRQIP